MRSPKKLPNRHGVTLVECLAVLVILAGLFALSMPGVIGWMRRNELARMESKLESLVSNAHRQAIRSGAEYHLRYVRSSNRLVVERRGSREQAMEPYNEYPNNNSASIPNRIEIQFLSQQDSSSVPELVIYPDGTISPGRILVSHVNGLEALWETHRSTGSIRLVTEK